MEKLPIGCEESIFGPEDESGESIADSDAKFRRELQKMLYGFGDVKNPQEKTVELLNSIIVEYITAVAKYGQSLDSRNKLTLQSIFYMTQHDIPKFERIKELLQMEQELKKARKNFENPI